MLARSTGAERGIFLLCSKQRLGRRCAMGLGRNSGGAVLSGEGSNMAAMTANWGRRDPRRWGLGAWRSIGSSGCTPVGMYMKSREFQRGEIQRRKREKRGKNSRSWLARALPEASGHGGAGSTAVSGSIRGKLLEHKQEGGAVTLDRALRLARRSSPRTRRGGGGACGRRRQEEAWLHGA